MCSPGRGRVFAAELCVAREGLPLRRVPGAWSRACCRSAEAQREAWAQHPELLRNRHEGEDVQNIEVGGYKNGHTVSVEKQNQAVGPFGLCFYLSERNCLPAG